MSQLTNTTYSPPRSSLSSSNPQIPRRVSQLTALLALPMQVHCTALHCTVHCILASLYLYHLHLLHIPRLLHLDNNLSSPSC